MSISKIQPSVILPASASAGQKDLTQTPQSFAQTLANNSDNEKNEPDHPDHSSDPRETFEGYNPLGQSTPLGIGWCVLDVIDNLVESTLPPMDIHELNIRLKLKRQNQTFKGLPPSQNSPT